MINVSVKHVQQNAQIHVQHLHYTSAANTQCMNSECTTHEQQIHNAWTANAQRMNSKCTMHKQKMNNACTVNAKKRAMCNALCTVWWMHNAYSECKTNEHCTTHVQWMHNAYTVNAKQMITVQCMCSKWTMHIQWMQNELAKKIYSECTINEHYTTHGQQLHNAWTANAKCKVVTVHYAFAVNAQRI